MAKQIDFFRDNPMLGNAVVLVIGLAAVDGATYLYVSQQALFENTVEVEGTVWSPRASRSASSAGTTTATT